MCSYEEYAGCSEKNGKGEDDSRLFDRERKKAPYQDDKEDGYSGPIFPEPREAEQKAIDEDSKWYFKKGYS